MLVGEPDSYAGAIVGRIVRSDRRRCIRPQERRLTGESDHQRCARFPRAERARGIARGLRPTETPGLGLVLYADPSVVVSRPRAATPATSPLSSRGG
jgi:hypothetical protein